MNLLRKITPYIPKAHLVDALIIAGIVFMAVVYKMNRMG